MLPGPRKPISIPPFVRMVAIIAAAAIALRPPRKISVSECAAKHRRLNNPGSYVGPWLNEMAPHLVEIMDRSTSRQITMLIALGPAQHFGKTEIFLNIIAHRAKYMPTDILLVQPTKELAADFSQRRVDTKCFRCSPDLEKEIGEDRSDDKRFYKVYKNGTTLTIAWPVGSQLSSRPVPVVLIDERDSMPDDIDEEGPPEKLGQARTETFGLNALVAVVSSPKRLDNSGIITLWPQGDQRLWHWPCAHCGEYFAPGFDRDRKPTIDQLFIPSGATEEIAREQARLVCPHCGAHLEERDKPGMNARGVWLPIGCTIDRDGVISGRPPATRIASYWYSGFAAPRKAWGDLAAEYVLAVQKFERTGDDGDLKAWYQTKLGAPYKPKHLEDAALDADALAARADQFPRRLAPADTRFITATVDVQGNRFVVLVIAWLGRGQPRFIDRFEIFKTIDAETREERLVDPANRSADWDLLLGQVIDKGIDVEGREAPVKPLRVAIDTGGKDGVTGQAYDFWLRARAKDRANRKRILLVKGTGLVKAPLVSQSIVEHDWRDARRKLAVGVKLQLLNVEALKDIANVWLRRTDPAATGYVRFSSGLPRELFDELAAEVKVPGEGWRKLSTDRRNESWDLFVYAIGAFWRIGGHRINWDHPPDWAKPLGQVAESDAAAAAAESPAPANERPDPPAPASSSRRSRAPAPWMIRRPGRGGFVGRIRA